MIALSLITSARLTIRGQSTLIVILLVFFIVDKGRILATNKDGDLGVADMNRLVWSWLCHRYASSVISSDLRSNSFDMKIRDSSSPTIRRLMYLPPSYEASTWPPSDIHSFFAFRVIACSSFVPASHACVWPSLHHVKALAFRMDCQIPCLGDDSMANRMRRVCSCS